MLEIIQFTPKLRHLFVKSLEECSILQHGFDTIPKLPQLTKLIVKDSDFGAEDLRSLLNAFDCRLKTLKIRTDLPSSFDFYQQWKQLISGRVADLDIFEIDFSKRGLPFAWYDHEGDDENGNGNGNENRDKFYLQNAINFVFDPLWYDHGWMAEIYVGAGSVSSSFRRKK